MYNCDYSGDISTITYDYNFRVFSTYALHCVQSPNYKIFKEPRNRFQGINSASICSLAGRYDNPIPTRFLAFINCLKIPSLYCSQVLFILRNERMDLPGVAAVVFARRYISHHCEHNYLPAPSQLHLSFL